MSFSIQAAGKIPDVIEQIKAHHFYDDATQAETIRELLLGELQTWGEASQYGVVIEASGHHDTNVRNLSITMRPIFLRG